MGAQMGAGGEPPGPLTLTTAVKWQLAIGCWCRFRCRFSFGSSFVLVLQVRSQALPLQARISLTS